MRNILPIILLIVAIPLSGADRDSTLARELLEDAVIRNDVEGIQLVRERLIRLAAETEDRKARRDAYYFAGLSALFESFSGFTDQAAGARLIATGIRHTDRALEIDPQFAEAWMMAAMLRGTAQRFGSAPPKNPPGTPNGFTRANEFDPKSPVVAFFNAMMRSFNPAGAAPAEGVQLFDALVARLDEDRKTTGRRFGLWDAQAYAWQILVRIASDDPHAEMLRPMVARLLELRPDFDTGRQLADAVAERRFVAAPAVTWQPFLTDASGDGKNTKLPDVVAVDRAETDNRMWYRVTFREPLPRSFGVNLVINRSGDPATGRRWWGGGSTFRFDRLVTAWISRDEDRYFGRIGVTDDGGSLAAKFAKISSEVILAMGEDGRSVMIGVPRDAIGLSDTSATIVAGGSHLVWNDDATSAANSR